MAFVVMCEHYSHSNPWSLEDDKKTLIDKRPVVICDTEDDARQYLVRIYNDKDRYLPEWSRGYDTNENHAQFFKDVCTKERMYVVRYVPKGGEYRA